MGNSDPVLNLLNDFKYNVIRLPRTNIRPLQILEKQGNDLVMLGEVTDLFVAGVAPLPPISPDEQTPFINGQQTRELEISVGLSLLGGIIDAMTGSKVKLDAAYKRAKALVFEFDDVKVNNVNQLQLSKFLTAAKIDTAVGPPAKSLEDDRLYVITNTVKSKKFTTEARQSGGKSVGVELPIIKGAVGGSVGVRTDGSNESKIIYEGDTPLVFGFQAVRMEFEKGVFKGFKPIKANEAGLRSLPGAGSGEPQEFEMLETDGPFVNLISGLGRGTSG